MSPIVCIVDDDTTFLWLLQEMLQGIGAESRTYSSALDFLDAYRPAPCECPITDLRMPEIGGLEVQRRLLGQQSWLKASHPGDGFGVAVAADGHTVARSCFALGLSRQSQAGNR